MYYAVYLGGPKWVKLMPPKTCPGTTGTSCQFKFDPNIEMHLNLDELSAPALMKTREAQFNQPGFETELKEVEALLNARGGQIDLKVLEARAQQKKPLDFYYTHGDAVEMESIFLTK